MRITVVGTGYVGLVVGAGLAEHGNDVVCVDIDPEKVRTLQRGKIPIFEEKLDSIINEAIFKEDYDEMVLIKDISALSQILSFPIRKTGRSEKLILILSVKKNILLE